MIFFKNDRYQLSLIHCNLKKKKTRFFFFFQSKDLKSWKCFSCITPTFVCISTHTKHTQTHTGAYSSQLWLLYPTAIYACFDWPSEQSQPGLEVAKRNVSTPSTHSHTHARTRFCITFISLETYTHTLQKQTRSFYFPVTQAQTETYLNETQALTLTSTHQAGMCCCYTV